MNSHNIEILKKEKQELLKKLSALEKRLMQAPDGTLRINYSHGKRQYGVFDKKTKTVKYLVIRYFWWVISHNRREANIQLTAAKIDHVHEVLHGFEASGPVLYYAYL